MQCYYCGNHLERDSCVCSLCGRPKSHLNYIPFWGTIGGIVGSFIGFSVYADALGALVGGLIGIVGCEAIARIVSRPRKAKHEQV
jgi:hypothetical protein